MQPGAKHDQTKIVAHHARVTHAPTSRKLDPRAARAGALAVSRHHDHPTCTDTTESGDLFCSRSPHKRRDDRASVADRQSRRTAGAVCQPARQRSRRELVSIPLASLRESTVPPQFPEMPKKLPVAPRQALRGNDRRMDLQRMARAASPPRRAGCPDTGTQSTRDANRRARGQRSDRHARRLKEPDEPLDRSGPDRRVLVLSAHESCGHQVCFDTGATCTDTDSGAHLVRRCWDCDRRLLRAGGSRRASLRPE